MGGHEEGWPEPSGLLPNGLLPNAGPVIPLLDSERWLRAEERTAELISCIQPNQPSEERRNAVADYVQRLIVKCFPCQVFTFGSVPLKTYLPDGDIDLTAFSNNQTLKDSWANQVRDMLESEEKNEHAEFRVKEVQYIQAEVKIIKCLVENIVVDISFNQLGGLCTLCFLDEVDNLINQNHLFKGSIILIKAWCYYESRILGAHHGLISIYALETLVLYVFHVFNNSFTGPLEVLFRFLEFFSNFDWDNFCVSLWGPVPIKALPDVTAESPRKDSGEFLLSKRFLDACNSVYAVFPSGLENQVQPFVSKHFNVIDLLRVNNNLGRSVSKEYGICNDAAKPLIVGTTLIERPAAQGAVCLDGTLSVITFNWIRVWENSWLVPLEVRETFHCQSERRIPGLAMSRQAIRWGGQTFGDGFRPLNNIRDKDILVFFQSSVFVRNFSFFFWRR